MTVDPAEFRDFEFQGWQKVANRYHDTFAGVTVQSIEALLDAAAVHAHTRLLDLACGPGYAAAAAHRRGALVVGIDFSSEMIAEAHRRFPEVDFREGDAESLDQAGDSFDAVVMNFGMLHLGRPDRAVAEAYRVLKGGGRFAFSVWDTPDKSIGFGIVIDAIRKYGDMNVPLPPGPSFFRFSDPAESTRLLEQAGFQDIRSRQVAQTWILENAEALFDIMMNASVRNAALLYAQKSDTLEQIEKEIRKGVEAYRTSAGYALPMPSVLYSAARRGV
jgi:ubiquinone/menaquinone biosynthesis C-methylase UbiE